ncbi:MAG: hypothetical protein HY904_25935 [Deltaproteobacteria bacterium]|nr:hypothetical protein [Deltaproteobacteria bacterium]
MATDFNEKVARARAAGKSGEAVALWRDLLSATNVEEEDYRRCCEALADLYVLPALKRTAAAAAIREYLRDLDEAGRLYALTGSARDMARVAGLAEDHARATREFQRAHMTAHAAHAAAQGGNFAEARSLWTQLVRPAEVQGNLHVAALARFNAGRAAQATGDAAGAQALFFEAMNALGQEADRREGEGDRDGAFRCYIVMKDVGLAAKAFEDVAEGYLNAARLLRQKGDRFGAVQALQELIRQAEEDGELHAASDLYREAGEYARRMGFLYADYFLVAAGHSWRRVAEEAGKASRPVAMVENALLAAVDAFNRTLNTREVVRCYGQLANLDLPESRKERYARLAEDLGRIALAAEGDEGVPVLPDYFRRRFVPVDFAVRELLDREAGVDLGMAAARLLADPNVWDVERRRALNLVLSYEDHLLAGGAAQALPASVMALLSDSRHPGLVPPLVEAFRRGETPQKVACVMAAGRMKLKEAMAVVDLALSAERHGEVYQAGLAALRGFIFPQALDSMVRLFGHHDDVRVKELALRNVATAGTNEAAEFLLDVVRSNAAGLATQARDVLQQHLSEKMLGALENNRKGEPNRELRQFISALLSRARRNRELPV